MNICYPPNMNAERCEEKEKLFSSSRLSEDSIKNKDSNKLNVHQNIENDNGMLEKLVNESTFVPLQKSVPTKTTKYRERQGNLAKKSRPLSTERVRKHRAKLREKKLQENSVATLVTSSSTLLSTERLEQHQNLKQQLIQIESTACHPDTLTVGTKVDHHGSDNENSQTNSAKKSRPLSTERVRKHRAKLREKKLQENSVATLATCSSTSLSTERLEQHRNLDEQFIQNKSTTCHPDTLIVGTQVDHHGSDNENLQPNSAKKSRPLSTERVRKHRAKLREKKLQENPVATLATCSSTSLSTERLEQHRNLNQQLIEIGSTTYYPDTLIVKAEVYDHNSGNKNLQPNSAKKSRPLSTERVRKHRAKLREKKLQENPVATLATSSSTLLSTERLEQHQNLNQQLIQIESTTYYPDTLIVKAEVYDHDSGNENLQPTSAKKSRPLSTERVRKHRAKLREKKLQENPVATLTTSSSTLLSTERLEQHQNLNQQLIQIESTTYYPDTLIVKAEVYDHDSGNENLQPTSAKKSRPLSTERVRKHRAKLREKKLQENPVATLTTSSSTLLSTERLEQHQTLHQLMQIESTACHPDTLIVGTQVDHHGSDNENSQTNSAKKSRPLSTERVRKHRAKLREKKLQENPVATLTTSSSTLLSTERLEQHQNLNQLIQIESTACHPDTLIVGTQVDHHGSENENSQTNSAKKSRPLSTERVRKHRARLRKKKLQENSVATLATCSSTSLSKERLEQHRNLDEQFIQNKSTTCHPDTSIVETQVYYHDSGNESLQTNSAKKSRPLSTERVRKHRAKLREKKLQENSVATLATCSSTSLSTERLEQHQNLDEQFIQNKSTTCHPDTSIVETQVYYHDSGNESLQTNSAKKSRPLSTERVRKHRAKLRGEKIQENVAALATSSNTLSSIERLEQHQNLDVLKYEPPNTRSAGVAIYHTENDAYHVVTPLIHMTATQADLFTGRTSVGEFSIFECSRQNGQTIIIVAMSISPNQKLREIIQFIKRALFPYSTVGAKFIGTNGDSQPIILSGNFNVNFGSDLSQPLLKFLKDEFDLSINDNPNIPKTKYGTTIDGIFTRYLNIYSSIIK